MVSNRVEYDASLLQICQKIAKYARMGMSIVPRSWMALPTREKAVTAVMKKNVICQLFAIQILISLEHAPKHLIHTSHRFTEIVANM